MGASEDGRRERSHQPWLSQPVRWSGGVTHDGGSRTRVGPEPPHARHSGRCRHRRPFRDRSTDGPAPCITRGLRHRAAWWPNLVARSVAVALAAGMAAVACSGVTESRPEEAGARSSWRSRSSRSRRSIRLSPPTSSPTTGRTGDGDAGVSRAGRDRAGTQLATRGRCRPTARSCEAPADHEVILNLTEKAGGLLATLALLSFAIHLQPDRPAPL